MSFLLVLVFSVNQVKCPFCDMTCTTLAALKIHIRFRHCDERPFPCDFCDKRWTHKIADNVLGLLSSSLLLLLLLSLFIYLHFSHRFKNQPDLQKHTEVHNEGAVYHCTVEGCAYSCHTIQTMSQHYKRVHEVRPIIDPP